MSSTKRLLVTGGCGFIGSHFIKSFLKAYPDWSVINLDKLTYAGSLANTKGLEGEPRYQFCRGDICDRALVSNVMQGIEAVAHFAAETHVDRSIDNADDFLTTNVLGTKTLLEAARRHRIRRFIHISTDEVYGSLPEGEAAENARLNPTSPYSASKAGSDLLVMAYHMTYGFPAIITRSSNNFGPNQFPEKVIPLFITNLIEGKKVPLYGDGKNRRDWIYVEDNCDAINLIFEKGVDGQIYNIGIGHDISNQELTRAILKGLGAGEDKINYVTDRLAHDFRYSIATEKIRALGFAPKHSFENGLAKTIEWYRQNESWWKPLKRDKFTVKA